MVFCFPASLVLGILGIILDRSKWLAITTTVVSGAFVLFYLCMMIISVVFLMRR